ncbi:MAG: cation-translocating P-type ATPase [Bacteroidales bacterium]
MWFSKSIESVLTESKVDPVLGLTDDEAKIRLDKFGENKLVAKKKKSIFLMFVAQLRDWLIYILFAAVIVTIFLGQYTDATIIVLVITINALLGVMQQVKAGKAIEALQKLTFPKALIRRSGIVKEIDSVKIVPGDILILDAGRFIGADLRLIESVNLQIEESALTGESAASDKDASLLLDNPKAAIGDRANCAFMSSVVTNGRGVGVVVGTGMNTEIGKIAGIINTEVKAKTPLEIRLDKLGKMLGVIAIGICVVIFFIALLQGRELEEMFLMSVSLAVAAIPEGLAAIVAVVLSIGVTGMSKKKAIIKKLQAVETLGSVTIICTDKTGTLTQNKMTVTSCFNLEGEIQIVRNQKNESTEDVKLLAKAMLLCSDATYSKSHGTGDPTEIALLLMADDFGIDRKKVKSENKRVGEFPFDSGRKLMTVLSLENGKYTVYSKGAIVSLLKISTHIHDKGKVLPITDSHRKQILLAAENMADKALRTLGAAYRPVDTEIDAPAMEKDLILIGLVGMMDPPRIEVKSAIEQAKTAGITTFMITGDHKNTAFAIAYDLGIAQTFSQVITGPEIDDLSEKRFASSISNFSVFARVSPEHKVNIVHALKSNGNIVCMTGDGVNDAPALNSADIGVAMGISGTDVAKGAADMILADDNFATIVTAIEQGRNIYNNIKKTLIFLLTCNLGEVIAVSVTLLIGWEAPLIATQLLWINLITDSIPAIALGMDPGSKDVMNEKPRDPKESFFAGGAGLRVITGGVLIGLLTILAFWYGHHEFGFSPFDHSAPADTVEYARTLAFMVLVICQLFYSMAVRNSSKSIFQIGVFSNKYLTGAILLGVLLQLLVIGIPVMQRAFHLQMLDLHGWLIVFSLGLVPLFFNELVKIFIRFRTKNV